MKRNTLFAGIDIIVDVLRETHEVDKDKVADSIVQAFQANGIVSRWITRRRRTEMQRIIVIGLTEYPLGSDRSIAAAVVSILRYRRLI